MEITKEIFQVAGPGLTISDDAASYVIKVGTAAALIDAGSGKAMAKLVGKHQKIRHRARNYLPSFPHPLPL